MNNGICNGKKPTRSYQILNARPTEAFHSTGDQGASHIMPGHIKF